MNSPVFFPRAAVGNFAPIPTKMGEQVLPGGVDMPFLPDDPNVVISPILEVFSLKSF